MAGVASSFTWAVAGWDLPTPQSTHAVAPPSGWLWPALHASQLPCPVDRAYDPGAQSSQTKAAPSLNLPASQGVQLSVVPLENFPASQVEHSVDPVPGNSVAAADGGAPGNQLRWLCDRQTVLAYTSCTRT